MDAGVLAHLLRSKGLWHVPRRFALLLARLGPTPARFTAALDAIVEVLARYGAPASFPTTAVARARHPLPLQRLAALGIEVAVHSYHHVDLSQRSPASQRDQVIRARQAFAQHHVPAVGFRAPYLRWNHDLLRLLFSQGFTYDSSTCALWPVLSPEQLAAPVIQTVLDFYRPLDAGRAPVLPYLLPEGLVEIPVSLPDDEMLVDRLGLAAADMAAIWRAMLTASHQAGELLVLQLHPERGRGGAPALDAVLTAARALQPAVWITTLAEVAEWWKIRPQCQIHLQDQGDGRWEVSMNAPVAARVLAQGPLIVETVAGNIHAAPLTSRWPHVTDVTAESFVVRSDLRPFIGLAPGSAQELLGFLRQQGYVVEISPERALYPVYFDWETFDLATQARTAVQRVEAPDVPLLRFSRWPDAARSALVVSGDIDSLTFWDYLWRLSES
ncbi:MAG: polysaccharide deacetylase family protein [Anaerolineae bacterium]